MKKIKISKRIKKKFPSRDFDIIDSFSNEYKKRHYDSLESKINKKDFARNVLMFLLCILKRSNNLYRGAISCINKREVEISLLAARAHMETTGAIAYLLLRLRDYYGKKISFEEMDDYLLKLHIGRRHYSDDTDYHIKVDSINVLTLIDSVDKVFLKHQEGIHRILFRDQYEFLSEFCHPNSYAQSIGVILNGKKAIFPESHDLEEPEIVQLDFSLKASCTLFFYMYDECFSLLEKNEEMPELIKK